MKKPIKIFDFPFYVVFVTWIGPLVLFYTNRSQLIPGVLLRPLLLLAGFVVIGLTLLFLIIRNIHTSAAILATLALLFFTFPTSIIKIALWLIEGFALFYLARRFKSRLLNLTRWFNLMFTCIVVLLGVLITAAHSKSPSTHLGEAIPLPSSPATLPDIYYIILDSYGRADLLRSAFNFDNSQFITALEKRGFRVDGCALSNYSSTNYSLASTFNMEYLPHLDDATLGDATVHSQLRASLEKVGYQTVAFASGFVWAQMTDADIYYSPPAARTTINEFEIFLLDQTPFHLVDTWLYGAQYGDRYRERANYQFAHLADAALLDGPQFVFAHIIQPHPPFVFDEKGASIDYQQFITPGKYNRDAYSLEAYKKGYIMQVEYVNTRILASIDGILARSTTPPIIILQGDHGPWKMQGNAQFYILSAYYLPGRLAPPACTPSVNTFRWVLSQYFGADLPLLADKQTDTSSSEE